MRGPTHCLSHPGPYELARYSGIVVTWFVKDKTDQDILKELHNFGLPVEYGEEDLERRTYNNFSTIYVHDLRPDVCLSMLKSIQGKEVFGKRLSAFTLIEETPTKKPETENRPPTTSGQHDTNLTKQPSSGQSNPKQGTSSRFWAKSDKSSSENSSSDRSDTEYDTSYEYEDSEFLKRKAKSSPQPATEEQFKEVSKNRKGKGRKKAKADVSTENFLFT